MRRIAATALLVALAGAMPATAQHAADDFVVEGMVLLGNPGTRTTGGVTESVSPCGESVDPEIPPGAAQGLDGYWIQLPEGAGGHRATLTAPTVNAVVANLGDVDAWYYAIDCSLIKPPGSSGTGPKDESAYHMATVGSNEFGTVPGAAAWVVVDLYEGAPTEFTYTVYDVG